MPRWSGFRKGRRTGAYAVSVILRHVLEIGVRRGRTDATFRDEKLADLALLPIRRDAETDAHAWGGAMRLATRHGLTLHDAAYLELALRRGLPLATLDRELRAAAQAEGVVLLGV